MLPIHRQLSTSFRAFAGTSALPRARLSSSLSSPGSHLRGGRVGATSHKHLVAPGGSRRLGIAGLQTSVAARAPDEGEKIGETQPAEAEGPVSKRANMVGNAARQIKDAVGASVKKATGQETGSEEKLFESRDELHKQQAVGKEQGTMKSDVMPKYERRDEL